MENYPIIWEACFDICVGLMWEKENQTPENIQAHTAELKAITEDFYGIALWHKDNIEDQQQAPFIIVRIIRYINQAHAIPPLRGNNAWFDYTMAALIELAAPNAGLSQTTAKVLDDFEQGIKSYRESLHEDDESFGI